MVGSMALVYIRYHSLHIDLVDVLVNAGKVFLKLPNEQVKLAHVYRVAFRDDGHEDVLADLHLLHKVLVIHDRYLEVATRAKLLELLLEVRGENVDTAAQASEEVLVEFAFELEVGAQPAEHLQVMTQLRQHDRLQVGHASHELIRLVV